MRPLYSRHSRFLLYEYASVAQGRNCVLLSRVSPVPLSLTVPGQIRTPINQNNVLHLQRQTQLGLPYTPQPLPPGVGPEELMSGPMNNIYITVCAPLSCDCVERYEHTPRRDE